MVDVQRGGDIINVVCRSARAQAEAKIAFDRHMREQRIFLEHDRDAPSLRRQCADADAAESHVAGTYRNQSRDRAQQRRLAGAGRPYDRQHFVGRHRKRETVQYRLAGGTVSSHQVDDFERQNYGFGKPLTAAA